MEFAVFAQHQKRLPFIQIFVNTFQVIERYELLLGHFVKGTVNEFTGGLHNAAIAPLAFFRPERELYFKVGQVPLHRKLCIRNQFWSEKSQAGFSGIMEAPGELVHGALYEVTEQELITLDNLEGVYKDLYKRETFLVLGEDGKFHPADLFRVIDPKGPFPPSRSYVEIMLTGARDLELDPEYIKKFEEFYRQAQ